MNKAKTAHNHFLFISPKHLLAKVYNVDRDENNSLKFTINIEIKINKTKQSKTINKTAKHSPKQSKNNIISSKKRSFNNALPERPKTKRGITHSRANEK